ncbi:tautomerase family protein [Mycobacterium hodleri]|uniref:tautomerase family protein n=1 Tax=Mycolicibacterium hodleri TaxID=49897 RepID=UPI0021F268CB|nr:tautomerase family protein [Mycolicibacterium hodleri]MCV7133445.1 tautomerase family protein [Mycolicibacterium hodleri]
MPQTITTRRRELIADVVYQTLVEVLDVPVGDRFQVIAHGSNVLRIDPHYLGIDRSPEAFIVDITLNAGRSTDLKQRFYAELVARLHDQVDVRPQDVTIALTEIPKENWSFGNGVAQYVT